MAYLWGDPRMGLRISNHENIPTYCVRQKLLQQSLVHLVSLGVFFSVFVYGTLELVIQEWISYMCPSIVILE